MEMRWRDPLLQTRHDTPSKTLCETALEKNRFIFKAHAFLKETRGLTRTNLPVMLYTIKNYIPYVRTKCDFAVKAAVRLGLPLAGMLLN
jgi:hypothetical protein